MKTAIIALAVFLSVFSVQAQDCSGLTEQECRAYRGWYNIEGKWKGAYKFSWTNCKSVPKKLKSVLDNIRIRYVDAEDPDDNDMYVWQNDDANELALKSKHFSKLSDFSYAFEKAFEFTGSFYTKPGYFTLEGRMTMKIPFPKKRRSTLKGWVIQDTYWYDTYQCTTRWRAIWKRR